MNYNITYQRYHQILKTAKFFVDLISVVLGYGLALAWLLMEFGIRQDIAPEKDQILVLASTVAIGQLLIFKVIGLYRKEITIFNLEETRKILQAGLLGMAAVLIIGFVLSLDFNLVKGIALTGGGLTIALTLLERHIFYKLVKNNHKKGKWVKKILIYDVCPVGKLLLKKLFEMPQLGYWPLGFVDEKIKKGTLVSTNSSETNVEIPVLGSLENLEEIVKKEEAEELLIATPSVRMVDMLKIIKYAKKANLNYSFVPNLMDGLLHRARFWTIGGIPLMKTQAPRLSLFSRTLKRLLDIAISLLLLVFMAPVFLVIGILIKTSSKGPVIFKQIRIGKNGKPFVMYKFRTMKRNVRKYEHCPVGYEDKRITRIGKYLRRTSLDELPQFLNALKGEMSIVGPRPEMGFIVREYSDYQRERLLVKPGITGIWQLTADRGREIHENMDYDIYYIQNASVFLDILIMFRTVWFAVRGVGAF
ncbi:MAG: sugar transferase [Patescibacteria group bacterium]|nr:sugar transferase [Patescibacteria group bacterium]